MKGKIIRVLLVEDNPVDAVLVEEYLAGTRDPRFELQQTDRLSTAVERLGKGGVDVLLLDLCLPDSEGLATFHIAQAALPALPIIVLSANSDEETAVEAVHAGAQDYLVKGRYDRELLTRSLRYGLERKRTQQALSTLAQRLSDHVSNSPLGVIEWGQELDIIRWSGEAERIFGWKPDEVIGKRGEEFGLVHHEDEPTAAQVFACLRSGATPRALLVSRNLRKDGSVVHCEWYNSALMDASGSLQSILSLVLDVSERKKAEEGLEVANRRLHQLSAQLLRYQDQERRKIARELHDSTAQTLAALSMNLSRLQRSKLDAGRKDALLSESLELAAASSREIRTLTYLLHPPLLDEVGLVGALQTYVEGFRQRTGISIELEVSPALGRLANSLELTLLRIIQEGLGNVHRHSGSRTARIELERDGEQVRLVVEDHGRGLPADLVGPDKSFAGFGVGILGMRERAEQLGGRLEITSGNEGTKVIATLPIGIQHGEITNLGSR